MPYDYSKLDGAITEKFGTRKKFSKEIGLSERSVSLKMSGEIGWKQAEIARACRILGIAPDDIPIYFFTLKVQNN